MEGALKGIFVSNSHNYKNMTNDIEFPNLTSNFYHVSSIFYRHFHYDYHTPVKHALEVIKGKVRVLSGLRCDTIRDMIRLRCHSAIWWH